MADRCPGSGLPALRLHLSAPQRPGRQRGSGRLGQAEGASADAAQPRPGLRAGGMGVSVRAGRGLRDGAASSAAPPASLRAGQAPAPAGASLNRAPGLEVSLLVWPRAQPRRGRRLCVTRPRPGFVKLP